MIFTSARRWLTLLRPVLKACHHEPRASARRCSSDPAPCLCSAGRLCAWLHSVRRAKGTLPHRTLGWIWVILMLVVALSSFWIHQIRLMGPWSPIHLLSIFTLMMLALGVAAARTHDVRRHKFTMIGIFFGALVIAGLFTLMPGRIMHAVVLGP